MVAYSGPGWRLAPSLIALFEQAKDLYPNRRTTSDGSIGDQAHQNRQSDHNPNSAGWVTAGDISHDPGRFDAHAFAEKLRRRRDPRVKYVISNRRMFASYATASRAAWAWGRYSGANPHTIHAHVSVLNTGTGLHDTRPWFSEDVMTPAQEAKLNRLIEAVGSLREHEKAHYDAVQARVRDLAAELRSVKAAVDPDADLSRRGSDARAGVREVVGIALDDLRLDARLSAIEAALGITPSPDDT
jgi:hypothetical protein